MAGIRLAQTFEVDGNYVPTKASLYLKRVVVEEDTSHDASSGTLVIDGSNFSNIQQATNKAIFNDTETGFTNSGYVSKHEINALGDDAIVEYPIKADTAAEYQLYLRGISSTGTFSADIFIDNNRVFQISEVASGSWEWFSAAFVLPDTEEHVLGIRLEESDSGLDKLYVSSTVVVPSGDGPDLSDSPYVTIHLQVYETNDSSEPVSSLLIYDYKTTITEVRTDDWYNFDINPIDSSIVVAFAAGNALVLSASGTHPKSFIIWELVDNDEYLLLPSALKV